MITARRLVTLLSAVSRMRPPVSRTVRIDRHLWRLGGDRRLVGAPLVGVSIAGAAAVMALSHRMIGGLTGDTLGAIEQVVECLVLVAVSRLALHHELGWR